jgi:MFS superfamily sulfate permease-like transporter/uncharacterized protein YciI
LSIGSPFEAWKFFDPSKVHWHYIPDQIFTLIAMFLVVAFSSSLDVAAIEMEVGAPLDYNHELKTVGISNLVSGLTGGYTGSYIFSQTIFNMRRGVRSSLCGFIIAGGELLVVVLPISITSYIPKMFFGSLLVLISADLMYEWLIAARSKMMFSEYAVCLLTFGGIQASNIELGMTVGILAAALSFVMTYSKIQSVSEVTLKSSTVIRKFEERSLLIANRGKIVTISFAGYIFFGSSVRVLEQIKSKLVLSEQATESLLGDEVAANVAESAPVASYQQGSQQQTASRDSKKPFPSIGTPTQRTPGTPYKSMDIKKHINATFNLMVTRTPSKSGRKSFAGEGVKGNGSGSGRNVPDEENALLGNKHLARANSYGAVEAREQQQPAHPHHLPHLNKQRDSGTLPLFSGRYNGHEEEEDADDDSDNPFPSMKFVYSSSVDTSKKSTLEQQKHLMQQPQSQPSSVTTSTTTPPRILQKPSDYSNSESEEDSPFKTLETQQNSNKSPAPTPGGEGTETGSGKLRPSNSLLDLVSKGQTERREGSGKYHPHRRGSGSSATTPKTPPSKSPRYPDNKDLLKSSFLNPSSKMSVFSTFGNDSAHKNEDQYNEEGEEDGVVTEYLVLDFTEVKGVDATAARSCFLTLVHLMASAHVTIVFASLPPEFEELLRAHRVIGKHSIVVQDVDDALEWCEDQVILKEHRLRQQRSSTSTADSSTHQKLHQQQEEEHQAPPRIDDYVKQSSLRQLQSRVRSSSNLLATGNKTPSDSNKSSTSSPRDMVSDSLKKIIFDYLEINLDVQKKEESVVSSLTSSKGISFKQEISSSASQIELISSLLNNTHLMTYFQLEEFPSYHLIYDIDDPSDKVYFIESGHVELVTMSLQDLELWRTLQEQQQSGANNNHNSSSSSSSLSSVKRVNKVCAGGIFGEADLVLARNHR